ncbi:MAG: hypothetical protein ABIF10_05990 [Candidatus Woesearchaeota archaeon]
MGLKEKFLQAYSNLPLGMRKEIIVVIDKEPFTWNAVYIEVYNDTTKSDILLSKLVELKIL